MYIDVSVSLKLNEDNLNGSSCDTSPSVLCLYAMLLLHTGQIHALCFSMNQSTMHAM
jgi:hypothetical protein